MSRYYCAGLSNVAILGISSFGQSEDGLGSHELIA
jgi:hypothetical protein